MRGVRRTVHERTSEAEEKVQRHGRHNTGKHHLDYFVLIVGYHIFDDNSGRTGEPEQRARYLFTGRSGFHLADTPTALAAEESSGIEPRRGSSCCLISMASAQIGTRK